MTHTFDRPGLTDLFVAVKANGVRLVLVERSDRLARDLMVGEIILSEFRTLGVRVIAVDCDTDLTVEDGDPTRTLMRQMLGAIAQWEKSVIVQKLRASRLRIRRTGKRCEGRKPYGSKPGEKETINKMREMRQKGESFQAIAEALNKAGTMPRTTQRDGKTTKWHGAAIQRILNRKAAEGENPPAADIKNTSLPPA